MTSPIYINVSVHKNAKRERSQYPAILTSRLVNNIYMLSFSFKTPGPGTYEVTHPNTNKKKMPAYTIKGRNYMPEDTTLKPGPGQHSPEKVNWKREHDTWMLSLDLDFHNLYCGLRHRKPTAQLRLQSKTVERKCNYDYEFTQCW